METLEVCHLCGGNADPAQLWRECDERDRLTAESPLLIVCASKPCEKTIQNHPRLYRREYPGSPGHFPTLCGDCIHRDHAACKHPELRKNGGAGLSVVLHDPFKNAIVCGRGGRIQSPVRAVECDGRATKAGELMESLES